MSTFDERGLTVGDVHWASGRVWTLAQDGKWRTPNPGTQWVKIERTSAFGDVLWIARGGHLNPALIANSEPVADLDAVDLRTDNAALTQTVADLRREVAGLKALLDRVGMRDATNHPSLRVVK